MPEQNVEVIESLRRGYGAYSRADFDGAVANFDPEISLVPAGHQAVIRGVAAVRAWMEPDALLQVVEPLEFHLAGNKVLVRQVSRLHGVESGIEAEFVHWMVWTYNEAGVMTRCEIYTANQEAEALEAAGLAQ